MYNLSLNNAQGLICHKIQQNADLRNPQKNPNPQELKIPFKIVVEAFRRSGWKLYQNPLITKFKRQGQKHVMISGRKYQIPRAGRDTRSVFF